MNKPDSKTFMIERSSLSDDAKTVWDSLSKTQQRDIHKSNPIRGDRNKIIRDLKYRQVKVKFLVEMSALSRAQIIRITGRDAKIPGGKLSRMKHRLSEARDRIDKTIQEINEV